MSKEELPKTSGENHFVIVRDHNESTKVKHTSSAAVGKGAWRTGRTRRAEHREHGNSEHKGRDNIVQGAQGDGGQGAQRAGQHGAQRTGMTESMHGENSEHREHGGQGAQGQG